MNSLEYDEVATVMDPRDPIEAIFENESVGGDYDSDDDNTAPSHKDVGDDFEAYDNVNDIDLNTPALPIRYNNPAATRSTTLILMIIP